MPGYGAIGKAKSAISPASVTKIDSTDAKIGRLMKNNVNTKDPLRYLVPLSPRFGGEGLGGGGGAGGGGGVGFDRSRDLAPSPPAPLPRSGGEGRNGFTHAIAIHVAI